MTLNPASGLLKASNNAPLLNALVTASAGSASASTNVCVSPYASNGSSDFSPTQGNGGWFYQYWTGTTYGDMQWDSANARWKGNEPYLLIMRGALHPGTNSDAALRWIAPQAGFVRVFGTVVKGDNSGGDGIVASIKRETATLWGPTNVAFNDVTGINHDLSLKVEAGDSIRFIINRKSGDAYDTTHWSPSIVYTTMLNPTNLALAATSAGLIVTWPGDHRGWTLMTQTNHLSTGLSPNERDWARVPGTQTNNQITISNSFSQPAAFFRLTYP